MKVVPAVEISAIDADAQTPRELHILGYDIDHTGAAFTARLAEFLADREQRTLRMAAALQEAGFELDGAQLERASPAGKPIGRPHLAEAVLAAPANAARLQDEQIDDIGSLIRGYLIEGRPAFRLRETPTVAEAIDGDPRRPAASSCGRTRSGTSPTPMRCSRRSTASARSGSTASRPSTSPTPQEQTELLAERCEELGLLQHRLGRLPRAGEPAVLASSSPSTSTPSSQTSVLCTN